MTKQIVMCPPHNFGIRYEINPWMQGNIDEINIALAAKQWNNVRNALVREAVDVIVMPTPPEQCPDAVFAANAGLAYKDVFIPSRFKYPERQIEEEYFEDYFDDHNFVMLEALERKNFEGAGDALFSADRKNLWLGFGIRTSGDFKFDLDLMLEHTDTIVRPLQLVDPRWYHLDTCFCPLDTGELLWYPPAFHPESQAIIELWYENKNIKVTEEDALKFACNAISVDRTIIMPHQTDELYFVLTERGYNVVSIDMSQFLKSGGACKCLTLELVK